MAEALVPIIVVPVIFLAIFGVIKTISDNGVRRKAIERGVLDENVQQLFQKTGFQFRPNSLKWGMVLIAVGVAILAGQMVPYDYQAGVTIGGGFLLSGLALVLYYFVAGRLDLEDGEE